MRDSTESRLRSIFDYQKFENEPRLKAIIDSVRQTDSVMQIADDELGNAAGGIGEYDGKSKTTE